MQPARSDLPPPGPDPTLDAQLAAIIDADRAAVAALVADVAGRELALVTVAELAAIADRLRRLATLAGCVHAAELAAIADQLDHRRTP